MEKLESIFIEGNEYIRVDDEERFCVYVVGPTLLHPRVTDKELKEKEINYLRKECEKNSSLKFDICFHSRVEMLTVYLYLLKNDYEVKLLEESPYDIKERFYNFEDLRNGKDDITFAGCRNVLCLSIDLTLENLDKLKRDLMNIRDLTGYKNIWESELSTEEYNVEIIS